MGTCNRVCFSSRTAIVSPSRQSHAPCVVTYSVFSKGLISLLLREASQIVGRNGLAAAQTLRQASLLQRASGASGHEGRSRRLSQREKLLHPNCQRLGFPAQIR